MKVSEIKEVIKNLKDEDEVWCVYNDYDELHFSLETEQDIIDMANNRAGEDDFEKENEEPIKDFNTALQYLLDFDDDKHFMS